MSSALVLSDEKEKELLRRCWYSHDARWYMAVAQEFGVEAANRLNKRVCRALGKAEMRRLVRALDIGAPLHHRWAAPAGRHRLLEGLDIRKEAAATKPY